MSRYEFAPGPDVIRLRIVIKGPARQKEVEAVFDPGAASVVVDLPLALELGFDLEGSPAEPASTASVSVPARRIVLEEVRAVGETVRDVPGLALDLNPLVRTRALLGNSFLRHFTVTFDLEEGYLELRPRPSRPA